MFFANDVPPGRHSLGTASIQVRRLSFAWIGTIKSAVLPFLALGAVRPDRARKEMMYLSYINGKKVLSTSVPKTDPREPTELRLKRRPEQ
jgi:hypothetical protein